MSKTENREKFSIFGDWSQMNVFFGILLIYPVSMFMFVFMFVVVYGFKLLVMVRLVSIVFRVWVLVVVSVFGCVSSPIHTVSPSISFVRTSQDSIFVIVSA